MLFHVRKIDTPPQDRLFTTRIYVFVRILMGTPFFFLGFPVSLAPSLLPRRKNPGPSESLSLLRTASGTRFVNTSASNSSPRTVCTFSMLRFDICCHRIVCTSRCFARLQGPIRGEIARALELCVQSSRLCVSPVSRSSKILACSASCRDCLLNSLILLLSISYSDILPRQCQQQLSTCFLSVSTKRKVVTHLGLPLKYHPILLTLCRLHTVGFEASRITSWVANVVSYLISQSN